jgi:hypothetical protein
MKTKIRFLIQTTVIILITSVAFLAHSFAQSSEVLSHSQIIVFLRSGVLTENEIIQQIELNKVNYTPNPNQIAELFNNHGTAELLTAINNNKAGFLEITQPTDNQHIGSSYRVKGNYLNINQDIWLFIYPELAPGKYWPQSDDAFQRTPAVKNNGTWSVNCNFGGPPQSYDIVVYKADSTASKFIGNTIQKWAKQNDYPGLIGLPNGLTELDRVTVIKD